MEGNDLLTSLKGKRNRKKDQSMQSSRDDKSEPLAKEVHLEQLRASESENRDSDQFRQGDP